MLKSIDDPLKVFFEKRIPVSAFVVEDKGDKFIWQRRQARFNVFVKSDMGFEFEILRKKFLECLLALRQITPQRQLKDLHPVALRTTPVQNSRKLLLQLLKSNFQNGPLRKTMWHLRSTASNEVKLKTGFDQFVHLLIKLIEKLPSLLLPVHIHQILLPHFLNVQANLVNLLQHQPRTGNCCARNECWIAWFSVR